MYVSHSRPFRFSTAFPSTSRRRVHRPARTFRLRQVDPAQCHRRPARRRRGADLDQRKERHLGGAQGSRHRHGVPVLCALSPHERAREHVLRPEDGEDAEARDREARRPGRPSFCRSCLSSTGARTSSPAASASVSPSAARWCAMPPCSCSTSRSPTSMRNCATSCASRSSGCMPGSARPRWSMSRTTRSRP